MPDVRETFCLIFFFADNFTGSKETEPYKTEVSFLCQNIDCIYSNIIMRLVKATEIFCCIIRIQYLNKFS